MSSQGYYYMGLGGDNKIYTLRFVHDDGSYHIQNLAVDYDTALTKAKRMCGDIPFEAIDRVELNDFKSRCDNYQWDGKTLCYGRRYLGWLISDIIKTDRGIEYLAEGYGLGDRQADKDCHAYVLTIPEVDLYRTIKESAEVEREIELADLQLKASLSQWLDDREGSEVELEVQIIDAFQFEGSFGWTKCIKAETKDGKRIVWFSGAKWLNKFFDWDGFNKSEVFNVKIKGIVKDYQMKEESVELSDKTYNTIRNVKSTILKRVKEIK